jgi:hypothetical protein
MPTIVPRLGQGDKALPQFGEGSAASAAGDKVVHLQGILPKVEEL